MVLVLAGSFTVCLVLRLWRWAWAMLAGRRYGTVTTPPSAPPEVDPGRRGDRDPSSGATADTRRGRGSGQVVEGRRCPRAAKDADSLVTHCPDLELGLLRKIPSNFVDISHLRR
jgi:hypothetical protein